MRRTAWRLLVSLLIGAVPGCGHYTPPATAPAPAHFVIHAPFDSAWTEAVTYVAETSFPIQVIDKPSGVITTRAYLLTSADSALWADCGKFSAPLAVASPSRIFASVNLFMRDYRDSVTVRVNLSVRIVYPYDSQQRDLEDSDNPIVCASTGRFEEGLMRQVQLAVR